MNYAGVGRRAVAVIIDSIIAGIVAGTLTKLLGGAGGGIGLLVYILYFTWMEATYAQTLGKMAMGLYVSQADGSPLTMAQSLIRNVLRIVDGLPFAYILGAIVIWMSAEKQRIGDHAAGTVVTVGQPARVSTGMGF